MAAEKRRAGQALIEFCLCLPLGLLGGGAVAWALLSLGAAVWLDLEAFALARAHLYGNALANCRGGELQKLNHGPFQTNYFCSSDGTVTGRIAWNGHDLAVSKWKLGTGAFSRR